jgi:hypothetical protein
MIHSLLSVNLRTVVMRHMGRIGTGLAAVGFVAAPNMPFACTPPVQCPTGSVVLTIDGATQQSFHFYDDEDYTLYGVTAGGRVINNTTGAVTWTGSYPVGKVDGTWDMWVPGGSPGVPPPVIPPVTAKTAKAFTLLGPFKQYKGAPAQSHTVAVGITNMTWADSRYGSCAAPAGSIVVRHLPPVAWVPHPL